MVTFADEPLIGVLALVCPESHCNKCNSIGCFFSSNYVPVEDWRCYQKKYENRAPRFETITY